MASSTLTLADYAAVSTTFTLRGVAMDEARYIDTNTSLQEPRAMAVRHSIPAAGSSANDRSYVTWNRTKLDANGIAKTISIKLEVSRPRTDVLTEADVLEGLGHLVSFLTEARATTLVEGICP